MEPKRITYDADHGVELRDGDVLRTIKGHLWLIVEARKMKSKYPTRWALQVIKVQELPDECRVFFLRWYSRGPKKRRRA